MSPEVEVDPPTRNPNQPSSIPNQGLTNAEFGVGFAARCAGDTPLPPLVVTQLTISVQLPNDATPTLIEHEEGHVTIATLGYYSFARRLATAYFGDFSCACFSSEAEAQAEGRRRAKEMANTLANAVGSYQSVYDQITQHGLNQDVTTEEALALILRYLPDWN